VVSRVPLMRDTLFRPHDKVTVISDRIDRIFLYTQQSLGCHWETQTRRYSDRVDGNLAQAQH
jgi:hypothetical protein